MELHIDRKAARLMGYEVVEDETPNEKIFLLSSCEIADGIIQEGSNYWWKTKMKTAYELRGDGGSGVWEKDKSVGNSDRLKEDNMDKPRIAQVLGVEVGEVWTFDNDPTKFRICADGYREYYHSGRWLEGCAEFNLCDAINHPDRIIRKPRFTVREVERAKAIKAMFPDAREIRTRNDGQGNKYYRVCVGPRVLCEIFDNIFPTMEPLKEYALEEIIGGGQ